MCLLSNNEVECFTFFSLVYTNFSVVEANEKVFSLSPPFSYLNPLLKCYTTQSIRFLAHIFPMYFILFRKNAE
jgi:hypothetical protein